MNTKPLILSAVLATAMAAPITAAQAEILAIGPHAKVLKKANLPAPGQTMSAVSKKYGAAKRVTKSKGKITKRNPKITRWDYNGFSVFFENSHVIHSVASR